MAVSAKNFRFVSPGVRIEEIDRSQIPADEPLVGACIIGRAKRGPAFTPVEVRSFSDFVQTFGEPVAGGQGGDVWRDGNYTSPMYGTYAAQSWLKNGESLTYIRMLGVDRSDSTSLAGWKIGTADFKSAAGATSGSSYALCVFPSASNIAAANLTGSVAAIFYMDAGAPVLQGTNILGATVTGSSQLIKSNSDKELVVSFSGSITGAPSGKFAVSFTKGKSNFIRKVFNTDPTLVGRDSGDGQVGYFLGETFENTYASLLSGSSSTTDAYFGAIVGLGGFKDADGTAGSSGDNVVGGDVQKGALESTSYSKSGWFLSQDLSSDTGTWSSTTSTNLSAGRMKKLFRFVDLDAGAWTQENIKVSLSNITAPKNEDVDPYVTFNVEIRRLSDSDDNKQVLESFEGCNLNADSDNYILNRIGDRYVEYDYGTKRLIEKGAYANRSKYVRVELNSEFSEGFAADYVPFGVTGPTKFINTVYAVSTGQVSSGVLRGVGTFAFGNALSGQVLSGSEDSGGTLIKFPNAPTRTNTSGLNDLRQAYWGALPTDDGGDNFKADVIDLCRTKPKGVTSPYDSSDILEYQYVISLEDLTFQGQSGTGAVNVGSSSYLEIDTSARAGGYSLTTTASLPTGFNGGPSGDLQSYKVVLNAGAGNLTTLFFGGTDGFDITQSDPLSNVAIETSNPLTSYEYNTYERAINTVKNPEIAAYNVISVPGLEQESLQNTLITNTDERADALAVIDIDKGYVPSHEWRYGDVTTEAKRQGNVNDAINTLKGRKLNSSYAATYYPWVKIRDNINAKDVWVPPSVAAIGAMSYTDRVQAPWFAPAGFNRGGLSTGITGVPVANTALKLFKDDRDRLYEVSINPIASFPNEGVVIFGQKTLQADRSALDRINVRRLLIFLKRGISRIANNTLFEPNVPDTWTTFKSKAIPFLTDVKTRYGLTDYKLILDETTTTPDLIDQNIMYAKLFIKPARAIEYIALDFIITNTGASFDD